MKIPIIEFFSVVVLAAAVHGRNDRLTAESMVPVDLAAVEGAAAYGAQVPFTTYPVFQTNVCKAVAGARFVRDASARCAEAMGWAFVTLEKTGAAVQFTAKDDADSVLVRYSLPYPTPRDRTYSLSLRINGKPAGTFELSSWHMHMQRRNEHHNHAYTPSDGGEAENNIGRWWDEATLMNVVIKAGDTVAIEKGEDDILPAYFVDLIDLENVSPPGEKPHASWISIVDEGATPDDDDDDDGPAISTAIAKAVSGSKQVWFPAGRFAVKKPLILTSAESGVTLQGAGMWHTTLMNNAMMKDVRSNRGLIQVDAEDVVIRHMKLDRVDNYRRTWVDGKMITLSPLVTKGGDRLRIENVWFSCGCSPIWYSGTGGVFINNRVRSPYADGLHLQDEASFCMVFNNHLRGCGDDAIVHWSLMKNGRGNVFFRNTAECGYMGRGIAALGGRDHLYSRNLVLYGNILYGILLQSYRYSHPDGISLPVENCVVSDNLVIGTGSRGALCFDARDNSIKARVERNRFIGEIANPISRLGTNPIVIEGEGSNLFEAP